MHLSIIIVNYNTKRLIKKCLESISRSTLDPNMYEIIVVDNASSDGSQKLIQQQFSQVKLIQNQKNTGFAAANNRGAQQASGKNLLLLNSDTEVFPATLEIFLRQLLENNASVASCQLLNSDGTIQPQGGSLPHLLNLAAWMLFIDDLPLIHQIFPAYQQQELDYFKHSHPVGWVGGTALLVKRSLYQKLNGLDEKIFMYAEDVDFCYRIYQAGETVWYFHLPKITHHKHGSSASKQSILGEFQGLKYYFKKHQPTWQYPLLRAILKLGAFLRYVVFGIIAGNHEKKDAYREAFNLA